MQQCKSRYLLADHETSNLAGTSSYPTNRRTVPTVLHCKAQYCNVTHESRHGTSRAFPRQYLYSKFTRASLSHSFPRLSRTSAIFHFALLFALLSPRRSCKCKGEKLMMRERDHDQTREQSGVVGPFSDSSDSAEQRVIYFNTRVSRAELEGLGSICQDSREIVC